MTGRLIAKDASDEILIGKGFLDVPSPRFRRAGVALPRIGGSDLVAPLKLKRGPAVFAAMDKPVEKIAKAVVADKVAAEQTRAKVVKAQTVVAKSTRKQEQSVKRQEKSVVRQEKSALRQETSADRRTELAADRTALASERTYAAWMRTGLAAMASAVGAVKLLTGLVPTWVAAATSLLLALFAAFAFMAAVWGEATGKVRPKPDVRHLPAWMTIGFSGAMALVAVAVIVGLWTH